MNRIVRVLGSIMGLVVLAGVVVVLVLMFKSARGTGTHPGLRGTPQPVKSPVATVLPLAVSPTVEEPTFTPTPKLGWETATLEDIHFGEPQVVLTDTLGLSIVDWISKDEVLIRRDTVPGGKESAIEVFNVKTQEVRRLAEGRIWGKPIWSSQEKAIAYLLFDESRKVTSLIWQPLDGEPVRILENAAQPVLLAPEGRGAMAYSRTKGSLVGKMLIPLEPQTLTIGFSRFAPPARRWGCGWKYDTAVSPDGEWQVVYNCEHFLLVNSSNSTIKELNLGEARGWEHPRWALKVEWSPDGQRLAVVATVGQLPNQIRYLLLVNPWINEVEEIRVPFGSVDEVSWAPNSHLLLTRGWKEIVPPGFELPTARLIDIRTKRQRDLALFPEGLLGANIAWSPDGTLVAFLCRRFEQGRLGYLGICISSVEVKE